jgi:hypothetical protein
MCWPVGDPIACGTAFAMVCDAPSGDTEQGKLVEGSGEFQRSVADAFAE